MIFIWNLIAHRGFKKPGIKENTLLSFQEAIKSPDFKGFEFDIRQTKDEYFIVNHNAFLNLDLIRLTTYKELKKKYNVLLLEDVLKLNTTKIFLIEIKDIDLNVSKFHKILQKYKNKNIYVMSFFNEVIFKLLKLKTFYKLGVLNYVLNTTENYSFDFICLLNSFATQKIVDTYEKKNIQVFIYGLIKEELPLKFLNAYYIVDKIPK